MFLAVCFVYILKSDDVIIIVKIVMLNSMLKYWISQFIVLQIDIIHDFGCLYHVEHPCHVLLGDILGHLAKIDLC